MKSKLQKNDKQKLVKVDQIVNYVESNKDSLESRRILSMVLNDPTLEPQDCDIKEFKARVGRSNIDELNQLFNMININDITTTDVISRDETDFPKY